MTMYRDEDQRLFSNGMLIEGEQENGKWGNEKRELGNGAMGASQWIDATR
jgi:hypothetical protein